MSFSSPYSESHIPTFLSHFSHTPNISHSHSLISLSHSPIQAPFSLPFSLLSLTSPHSTPHGESRPSLAFSRSSLPLSPPPSHSHCPLSHPYTPISHTHFSLTSPLPRLVETLIPPAFCHRLPRSSLPMCTPSHSDLSSPHSKSHGLSSCLAFSRPSLALSHPVSYFSPPSLMFSLPHIPFSHFRIPLSHTLPLPHIPFISSCPCLSLSLSLCVCQVGRCTGCTGLTRRTPKWTCRTVVQLLRRTTVCCFRISEMRTAISQQRVFELRVASTCAGFVIGQSIMNLVEVVVTV